MTIPCKDRIVKNEILKNSQEDKMSRHGVIGEQVQSNMSGCIECNSAPIRLNVEPSSISTIQDNSSLPLYGGLSETKEELQIFQKLTQRTCSTPMDAIEEPTFPCEEPPIERNEEIKELVSKPQPDPETPRKDNQDDRRIPLEIQILTKMITLGQKSNCDWIKVVNELSKVIPVLKKRCCRITTDGENRILLPYPSLTQFPILKPNHKEPIKITKIERSYGPISGGTIVRIYINQVNFRSLEDFSLYFGKSKVKQIKKITPSLIYCYLPPADIAGTVSVIFSVRDGTRTGRMVASDIFEYLSIDDYLVRRREDAEEYLNWDHSFKEPLTILNSDVKEKHNIFSVKLNDYRNLIPLGNIIESLTLSKQYQTLITIDVSKFKRFHLTTIKYDYDWDLEKHQAELLLSLRKQHNDSETIYQLNCNGDRKASFNEDNSVTLSLPLQIVTRRKNENIQMTSDKEIAGPFILKLRQRSTGMVVFEAILKTLHFEGDNLGEKLMIERQYSDLNVENDIDSPFISNALGQSKVHQCCITGKLDNLAQLRLCCDQRDNYFTILLCTKDNYLRNALHLAFSFGHLEICKFLIYRIGMNMAAELLLQRDHFGMTPFHLAVLYKNTQFLTDICSWMSINTLTSTDANEAIHVPQIQEKVFSPVIVSQASPLLVANLISDVEDEPVESNPSLPIQCANYKRETGLSISIPKNKRKRYSSYPTNKRARKHRLKSDKIGGSEIH